jgi:hypothetical protein
MASLKRPLIYDRKNISIVIQGKLLIPVNTGTNLNNLPSIGSGGDISLKTSDTMDQFVKADIVYRRLETEVGTNAAYTVMHIGYGAKLYLYQWGEFGKSYGLFNLYAIGSIDGCFANRNELVSGTAPSDFSGLGLTLGAGIEFIFSPFSSFTGEIIYQRAELKVGDVQLPLDGFTLSAGIKVGII